LSQGSVRHVAAEEIILGVIRAVWQIVWTASLDFVRHQASRMGASLAFYSVLSLAPLLVLTLVVGGMFVNEQEIRDQLIAQMQQTVGREGSEALADMLTKRKNGGSLAATLLGIATLLFGASGVFGELQHAMNTIWGVEAQANAGWWRLIRDRFLAFVLVVGSGMLLLATLVLSTFVAGAGEYLTERWPRLEPLGNVPTMLATFGVITFSSA
jgi:membrane protein